MVNQIRIVEPGKARGWFVCRYDKWMSFQNGREVILFRSGHYYPIVSGGRYVDIMSELVHAPSPVVVGRRDSPGYHLQEAEEGEVPCCCDWIVEQLDGLGRAAVQSEDPSWDAWRLYLRAKEIAPHAERVKMNKVLIAGDTVDTVTFLTPRAFGVYTRDGEVQTLNPPKHGYYLDIFSGPIPELGEEQ